MANTIEIQKVRYFGNDYTQSNDWNAKVIYKRNGKLHHAMIEVDFFAKQFYINKKIQATECKVYAGLHKALEKINYFEICNI